MIKKQIAKKRAMLEAAGYSEPSIQQYLRLERLEQMLIMAFTFIVFLDNVLPSRFDLPTLIILAVAAVAFFVLLFHFENQKANIEKG